VQFLSWAIPSSQWWRVSTESQFCHKTIPKDLGSLAIARLAQLVIQNQPVSLEWWITQISAKISGCFRHFLLLQ